MPGHHISKASRPIDLLSCPCSSPHSFQQIFFKFTPNIWWTKIQHSIYSQHPEDTFVTTGRLISCLSCSLYTPELSKVLFILIIGMGWIKVQIPMHFCHSVTFVATRGSKDQGEILTMQRIWWWWWWWYTPSIQARFKQYQLFCTCMYGF